MRLTRSEAAVAYARCWNVLDLSYLGDLLDKTVVYSSQNVFGDLTSKKEVVEYLAGKIETIRNSPNAQVYAELGCVRALELQPCVLMAQGSKDVIVAVVLFDVHQDKIKQISMCSVAPNPSSAGRFGEYPN